MLTEALCPLLGFILFLLFSTEDESSTLLRNVGKHLVGYTTSLIKYGIIKAEMVSYVILAKLTAKICVLWEVTPCSLVDSYV